MAALQGVIMGMGNPLLDISVDASEALLEKYGLKPSNAILAEEKHLALYPELIADHQPVQYVAGGATQNSIRVAQWMLQVPGATTFLGAVGQDDFASQLRAAAASAGVNALYLENPSYPTGKCAVIVVKSERSLCAHLAAAEHYDVQHLQSQREVMEKAKYFYIAAFFLTHQVESALVVAKHAAEHNKVFAMNLAAPFLMQFFISAIDTMTPYMDFVFANEHEAEALGDAKGWGKDIAVIAQKFADLPKINTKRPRIVVFTHGPEPVTIAISGSTEVKTFVTPKMSKADIVDTNGAGDAFVGGFLSQLVQDKSLEECVNAGNYAAQVVLRHSGCTFPATPSYKA
eukprot:TRINITY_DN1137_c0_g1_i1.p1 TRINITY_DN1137_c0_g1~~TRINITY_DN1137_c0_g1_i1.p1  ORF type:complete len:356 (+),score=105.00 TRINITY_DN1137_c0_g1_i1:37-1068(+)